MSNNESIAVARLIRDKEMRKVLVALAGEGHRVVLTRNGHYRVLHTNGVGQVTMAGTPSDYRALRNTMATLRREGFQC
jgi:hypothetical protein